MTALTGLELRKAACEALGWWQEPGADAPWWHSPRCKTPTDILSHAGCYFPGHVAEQDLPAIESDPAISEPMFLEFCNLQGWTWMMRRITEWNNCGAIEIKMKSGRGGTVRVFGATPSEARARAIVEASKP